MKPCLVDTNVMLALLVRHHKLALRWFDALAAGEAMLCRAVQLAVLRLLANPTIMGDFAVSASAGWNILEDLLLDERVSFAPEPDDVGLVFPTFFEISATY
jgi:predicted nucleic acid-binding protein